MSSSCTRTGRRRTTSARVLSVLALAGLLLVPAGVATATSAHAQAAPPGGYGPSAPESPTDLGLTGPVAVTATVGPTGATLAGAAEGGLTPTLVVPPGALPRPAQVTVRLLPVNPLAAGSPAGYLGGWLVTVTAPDGEPYARLARAAVGPAMTFEVRGAAIGHPDQVVTVLTPSGSTPSGEPVGVGLLRVPVTGTSTAVVLTGPAAAGAPTQQPEPQPGRGGGSDGAGGKGNGGNGGGAEGRRATQRPAVLPVTGSSTSAGIATGLTAVGLGTVLLLSARRRRTGER